MPYPAFSVFAVQVLIRQIAGASCHSGTNGEIGSGASASRNGSKFRSLDLIDTLPWCFLNDAPRPRDGRSQCERCKNHHRSCPPVDSLATHDHGGCHHRRQAVAGKQISPVPVGRLRSSPHFIHPSLVEFRRQTWDRRSHRPPQQTIHLGLERIFARFHLSHRNIPSLSACHGEACARDSDTI